MEKVLLIDTSDSQEVAVGLKIGGKTTYLRSGATVLKAQMVLPLTAKILKKQKVNLSDLTGIEVNTGPGSFTGLRVGVAVANTLGWALGIPVNGKRRIVWPVYEKI